MPSLGAFDQETIAALREENDRLRWVVKGAHGALADAASVIVPGVLDGDIAPAIRQLTRERDEAREKLASLEMDYPNLDAIAHGTISGPFSEWPRVKPEAVAALHELAALREENAQLTRERDEARAEGEQWRAASDTCEMECRKLRAEVERLREALGRVLTEAGLQAHKHGCANKIARPAQWDARLPCAGCQAESALQGR